MAELRSAREASPIRRRSGLTTLQTTSPRAVSQSKRGEVKYRSDRLTVCDLTQSYGPSSGGVRTYVEAKRRALLRSTDWRHVLIVPGEKDTVELDGRLTTYKVASPRVPNTEGYRFIVRADKVGEILRLENPDVVELGSPYLLPWEAFKYRTSYPCAVVGYYHTDFPHAYAGVFVGRALGKAAGAAAERLAQRYARVIYGRCDVVVTSSQSFEDRLRVLGVPRVRTVPLAVDLDTFNPIHRDEKLRERLELGVDDALLVYAGRLDAEKRVDVLPDAVRRLDPEIPAHLLLFGEGPLRKKLEESTKGNPRIRIGGYVSERSELARYLASADIYVTAGPHETFGLSVLEAQASGLPVVGVRAGALIDRVPETVGRLGPPGSAEEMARNIEQIWRGPLHAMSRSARRHVEENYSWERTFRDIFEVYETARSGVVQRDWSGRPEAVLERRSEGVVTGSAERLARSLHRCGRLLGFQ